MTLDQVLTVVVCVGLPLSVVMIAAILGTRSRLKLAERLAVMISEKRFASWSNLGVAFRLKLLFAIGIMVVFSLGTALLLMFLYPSVLLKEYIFAILVVMALIGLSVSIILYTITTRMR